jgi:hypothetical protein
MKTVDDDDEIVLPQFQFFNEFEQLAQRRHVSQIRACWNLVELIEISIEQVFIDVRWQRIYRVRAIPVHRSQSHGHQRFIMNQENLHSPVW